MKISSHAEYSVLYQIEQVKDKEMTEILLTEVLRPFEEKYGCKIFSLTHFGETLRLSVTYRSNEEEEHISSLIDDALEQVISR